MLRRRRGRALQRRRAACGPELDHARWAGPASDGGVLGRDPRRPQPRRGVHGGTPRVLGSQPSEPGGEYARTRASCPGRRPGAKTWPRRAPQREQVDPWSASGRQACRRPLLDLRADGAGVLDILVALLLGRMPRLAGEHLGCRPGCRGPCRPSLHAEDLFCRARRVSVKVHTQPAKNAEQGTSFTWWCAFVPAILSCRWRPRRGRREAPRAGQRHAGVVPAGG